MEQHFSKHWMASKQPRKQIKFRANAPLHLKRAFLSATLDKALRATHGVRSITLRKGDEVKVMRGSFKKKQGKVGSIDLSYSRVEIEGLQRSKKGGEKVQTWFHPSTLKVIKLADDARRFSKKNKSKEAKN